MRHDTSDHRSGALWTPGAAEDEARRFGIDPLLERHWTVIALCRELHARTGRAPALAEIASASGLTPHELVELFRADPELLIIRIAGLPDPRDPADRCTTP